MKKITSFIRLTTEGKFEKVTWLKSDKGEKQVVKESVRPSQSEALHIALMPYQEVSI